MAEEASIADAVVKAGAGTSRDIAAKRTYPRSSDPDISELVPCADFGAPGRFPRYPPHQPAYPMTITPRQPQIDCGDVEAPITRS